MRRLDDLLIARGLLAYFLGRRLQLLLPLISFLSLLNLGVGPNADESIDV
jgi:hypothetical protein